MNREASINLLNKAVADELQAVHQQLYFHFHLEDQGLGPLAVLFRKTAIEEMGHIAKLSERILFLKGDVKLQAAGPVETIKEPLAMLEKAKKMEDGSITAYSGRFDQPLRRDSITDSGGSDQGIGAKRREREWSASGLGFRLRFDTLLPPPGGAT